MSSTVVIILVVVVVLLVLGAVLLIRHRRGAHLREQFGSEYDRTVDETGGRRRAEQELEQRRDRRESLDIRPLPPDQRELYREHWARLQQGFPDDPGGTVRNADGLVVAIMRDRGYPVGEFDQRAADVSVDHPDAVEHYREARRIAEAHGAGRASTDDLRLAVTSYRALVDALLEDGGPGRPGDGPGDRSRHGGSPAAIPAPPGQAGAGPRGGAGTGGEEPVRVMRPHRAEAFRARWDAVQARFVDQPREAVGQADELVGDLLEELSWVFRNQRADLEQSWDDQEGSTENLRVALRRYRELFDRLLSM